MNLQVNDKQIWLNLYSEAERLKQLAPWEWMDDGDLFAVQVPREKEVVYCGVMGNMGELFGINVYLGEQGLDGYFDIIDKAMIGNDSSSILFSQKCLQVFFLNRDGLTDEDKQQIKELGLKFRGANQWIQFREQLPGYYPWYISESQAVLLKIVLQQLRIVAERLKDDPDMLINPEEDEMTEELYFLRNTKKQNGEIVWFDDWHQVIPGNKAKSSPNIKDIRLGKIAKELKQYKSGNHFLTCLILPLPKPVLDEKDERPYFPVCVVWLDSGSELILMNRLCKIEELDYAILSSLLDVVEVGKARPKQILVPDIITHERLETTSKLLTVPVGVFNEKQEHLEEIKNSLLNFW